MLVYNENQLYFKYSLLPPEEKILYYSRIKRFVKRLSWEYPKFWAWYEGLFFSNAELKCNREIIICESHFQLAGISILKRDLDEKKICTFRVDKNFQKQGIGTKLMQLSFEWLDCDTPLITVQRGKVHEFQKLFDYYNFQMEEQHRNYYHLFSTEVAYNGTLPPKGYEFSKFEIISLEKYAQLFLRSGNRDFSNFVEQWLWQLWEQTKLRDSLLNRL